MDCWLNVYKPRGISSAKVVAIAKKALKGSKVGHTGTLDLEAEGVLPLAIGEATKLVKFLIDSAKTYIFTIQFGAATDTGDFAGKIINSTDSIPNRVECMKACQNFIGVISQKPPIYSAIKIKGVPSYKLARLGKSQELSSRKIEIYGLELLNFDSSRKTATFIAKCSKGTYIRTLAEDIALSLQSLGFVIELRRTQVGAFRLDNSLFVNELEKLSEDTIHKFLEEKSLKIEAVLDDIPVLDATEDQAQKIRFGQRCIFELNQNLDSVWIRYNHLLLAIGSVNENCFNSSRVFNII
ncbi:MAG: tRNA pseudouridine(55) synthase TruB [Janthinobacterium lividum]